MKAIEQDKETRHAWLREHSIAITLDNSVVTVLLCVLVNLIIIILYSLPLLSAVDCQRKVPQRAPALAPGPAKASAHPVPS